MNPVPLVRPCSLCCRPTSMWCSRCQNAWYCTQEHLQNDWPRHRIECIPTTHAQNRNGIVIPPPAEQQPGMIIMSAILFSPGEERPRIIAVQCRRLEGPSMDTCPQPIIILPDGQAESIIVTHGLNDSQLHYPLQLWYSPTALSRGAPINRPIYHMTVGSGAKQWHGIVVVLKFSGSRRRGYSHASLNDLPDLAAYFLAM